MPTTFSNALERSVTRSVPTEDHHSEGIDGGGILVQARECIGDNIGDPWYVRDVEVGLLKKPFEGGVVCHDMYRKAEKKWAPFLESMDDSAEFFLMDQIVSFGRGERAGVIGDRLSLIGGWTCT
ncbi:hypothetical protein AYX15_07060 [Cryptococcus neoformans]|nr:hypothetical protein AYX15_07060 [Cryptococcus neoformans var. grubii]